MTSRAPTPRPRRAAAGQPGADLRDRIAATLAEIEHIERELRAARAGVGPIMSALLGLRRCELGAGSKALAAVRAAQAAARGPARQVRALERDLEFLGRYRTWLHARLVETRGEPLFPPEWDSLVAAGIVAPPANPQPRRGPKSRGRPADAQLVVCVREVVRRAALERKLSPREIARLERVPGAQLLQAAASLFEAWTGRRIEPTQDRYKNARQRIGISRAAAGNSPN